MIQRRIIPVALIAALLAAATPTARGQSRPAAASKEVPVLVFLPPQVNGPGKRLVQMLETYTDMLSDRTGTSGAVKVVDRRQIQKLLQERRLGEGAAPQMISFDTMVRVQADFMREEACLTVTVVDLVHGRLLGSQAVPWTGAQDDRQIQALADLCRNASLKRPGSGQFTVRIAESPAEGSGYTSQKLTVPPLLSRLSSAVEKVIRETPDAVEAHHLEATSAAEESLLLMRGLSCLPGQRQFRPQADVLLELSMLWASNPDYRPRSIEGAYRLNGGPWTRVVKSEEAAEALVAELATAIGADLKKFQPRPGAQTRPAGHDMAQRRRQAEAEMAAYGGSVRWEHYPQVLRAATIAAKIDPTFEKAAFWKIVASDEGRHGFSPNSAKDPTKVQAVRQRMQRGLAYLREFTEHPVHRAGILVDIFWSAEYLITGPAIPEFMEEYRQALEISLSQPHETNRYLLRTGMRIRYLAQMMKASGMPSAKYLAWRDAAFDKARKKLEICRQKSLLSNPFIIYMERNPQQRIYWEYYPDLELDWIACLLDEGEEPQAKKALLDLVEIMKKNGKTLVLSKHERKGFLARFSDYDFASQMRKIVKVE